MINYNLETISIKPLSGQKPQQAVIFFHGYGGSGKDISSLAINWQRFLPDSIFMCPNAPEACSIHPDGFQWFDLTSDNEKIILEKSILAEEKINIFIDQILENFNLKNRNLALVGFSQGTMMSLHVSLRRKNSMAAVLGYSGKLIGADLLKNDLISKPSIYLIHGDQDPMVPYQETLTAEKTLKEHGVDIKTHISKNTQHSIAEDGLRIGIDFLGTKFKI